MNGYIKTGTSTWSKTLNVYVKTATSTWSKITKAWIKTASGWNQWFGAGPTIQYPVTISTSSSSYPATLTGTNYHWYNATSLTYQFAYSTDNSTFYTLVSGTATNPAVGSSNTNTRALVGSDFAAPTTYFKYIVTATGSGGSSSSVSSSVSVTYPAPTIATGTWSGSPYVGQTLTYTVGASTNAYYQITEIRRNDAYQTLLASGTGSTVSYTTTSSDDGYNLYAYTTVTGYGGSAYCAHVNTATITTYPAPTVTVGSWTGGTSVGTVATYNVGTFTNTTSYVSYLKRADSYDTLLVTSSNALSTSYTLASADVGYQLYAYTVATGLGGSVASASAFTTTITAGVAPSDPVVTGDNSISPHGGQFYWGSTYGTTPI